MDLNPSPPRSKAQERDANGHSNSSNPGKVGLTKPGAYSKQIEIPFRYLWVHKYQYLHSKSRNFMEFPRFPMPISTYTLVMGCKLKTPISQPFLLRLSCDWAHFEGLEALFPTSLLL